MCADLFYGIEAQRILRMTDSEMRLFVNIKKAFYESDVPMRDGTPEDRCLAELFTAIDTAKTLRRSLLDGGVDYEDQKKRFIEFLGLTVPYFARGRENTGLVDRRTGRAYLTLGEVVYDIRCKMVHEGENLNLAEDVDYHIHLDWRRRDSFVFGEECDGRCIINGFILWKLLREGLSVFITGIENLKSVDQDSFFIGRQPELGSIRPTQRKRSIR